MIDLDALIQWATEHPLLAGGLVFLIAFVDALLVVGSVVPAIPLLFALGTLMGLGVLEPISTLTLAALGAFCGDGVSYLIGRRYGDHLAERWPFSRYPSWLAGGRRVFERHGSMGIVIGRFVGALRPFVPAIAGMLKLPPGRYLIASGIAAVGWSLAFIGPGWLFGSAWTLLKAVAGPLLLIVGGLVVALLALGYAVTRAYRWLAPRGARWLERGLAWSRRHPYLGRLTRGLVDPTAPESTSLFLLAVLLIVLLSAGLAAGLSPAPPSEIVANAWRAVRSPWSDALIRPLLALTHPYMMLSLLASGVLWAVRQRSSAAGLHWLLAAAGGLAADLALTQVAERSWLAAPFLVIPATLAALLSLAAIMVARESRIRHPARPYLLASTWLGLSLFAQNYFQQLDAQTSMMALTLGGSWGTALGIALRRHTRPFNGTSRFARVSTAALCVLWAVTAAIGWSQLRASSELARHDVPIAASEWWRGQSAANSWLTRMSLPGGFVELQYAGERAALEQSLRSQGWQPLARPTWSDPLQLLNSTIEDQSLPILPLARDGFGELSRWQLGGRGDGRNVLFIWPTRWRLSGSATPVYRVQVVPHELRRVGWLLRLWLPAESAHGENIHDDAQAALLGSLPPDVDLRLAVGGWRARQAAPGSAIRE